MSRFGIGTRLKLAKLGTQITMLQQKGQSNKAIRLALEARQLALEQWGEDHDSVLAATSMLAQLYMATGRVNEAEPFIGQMCDGVRAKKGENSKEYAFALGYLAAVPLERGKLAEAEPLFLEAASINRRIAGEQDPQYASTLVSLGRLYRDKGDFLAAEKHLQQAAEIYRATQRESDPNYASCLQQMAQLQSALGKYAEAERYYFDAAEIMVGKFGQDHPLLAPVLVAAAQNYQSMGNYEAAEGLYQRAGVTVEAALGSDSPNLAPVLDGLANLQTERGNYTEAESLYMQANRLLKAELGDQHPSLASNLSALGSFYVSLGRPEIGMQHLQQAAEIERQSLGESYRYAAAVNSIGRAYLSAGDFSAAERLMRQANEITRSTIGERHPDFARSLTDWSGLYRAMGDYVEAESLLTQALDIAQETLGVQHPFYAEILMALAANHAERRELQRAELLLKQAREVFRDAYGEEHIQYAGALHELGRLYALMRDYQAAQRALQQASDISLKIFGEKHSAYAASLNNMAIIFQARGDYAEAERLLRRANQLGRETLGPEHPDLAANLSGLAQVLVATEREAEAMTLLQEAAEIHDRTIGQVFSVGSERQRMAYLQRLRRYYHTYLSLLAEQDDPAVLRAGMDYVLRRKAIGAEALAAQRDAVLSGRYPELEAQIRSLDALRAEIADKLVSGPGPEGAEDHRAHMAELNAEREKQEALLARQIPEMNLERQLRSADRQAIARELPAGSALVEFVRYDVFNFESRPDQGDPVLLSARYLAFVLRPPAPDDVQMIVLGVAESIDEMITAFRVAVTRQPGDQRNLVYAGDKADTPTGDGQALRAALFDPLLPALGSCRRLFLAPDGDLTRLPFEILPLDEKRCLIDDYEISYLSVGRDLLRFGSGGVRQAEEPYVVADPDFDLGTTAAGGVQAISRQSRDLNRADWPFKRLEGAREEGESVANLLDVAPSLGESALESKLKERRSPHILHIATHGFFLADQSPDPRVDDFSFGLSNKAVSHRLDYLARLENPLLRSGLALAGANTWLEGGLLPEAAEDAILNAEDVSSMDLLSTELVVLSACDTALGEVRVGEGVFGFRRAFVLAGADTLVMSLWKVPDQQTQELMIDFYRRLLDGHPRAAALRGAQLAMKAKHPAPLFWGAFICQGDPGKLLRKP